MEGGCAGMKKLMFWIYGQLFGLDELLNESEEEDDD